MNKPRTLLFLTTSTLAVAGCDGFDPVQIHGRNFLPAADYQPDMAAGEVRYRSLCARCHGDMLQGSDEGPPLHDPVYASSRHGDLAFYHAVNNGVRQHHWQFGDMPMLTGITPEQVSDIVHFVRNTQRIAGIE